MNARATPLLGGLALAAVAAWAPPATTLGLALAGVLVSSAVALREESAIALLWGLSIIPLYLNVPSVAFPIPLELLVAMVLMWRTFVVGRRVPQFGTAIDRGLLLLIALGVVISTLLSPNILRSTLNSISLLIWLFHIPLARAIYQRPGGVRQSLRVLAVALGAQGILGFVQLVAGFHFAIGVLTSPVASLFFNQNALISKIARQDFNWLIFDRTFPSGLFINSIVYGLCLTVGGLTLMTVPRTWLPPRFKHAARVFGAIALVAAFASFKVSVWLAMLAGAVVLIVTQRPHRRVRLQTALLPLGLLATAAALTREMVSRRVVDVLTVSAMTRLLIWGAYAGSLVHHGLIGVGPGQAQLVAPTIPTLAAGQNIDLFAAPENSWLGLAVEVGVPAMLALLILLVRMAVRSIPPRATFAAPGITAALVGCTVGVYGLTDEHILPLLALLGGMTSALESPAPQEKAETKPIHV